MSSYKNEKEEAAVGGMDLNALVDDLWKGFKKFAWLVAVLAAVFSVLFYMRARFSYTPYYQASATFTINANTGLNYSNNYYNNATATQMAQTFPYIISSGVLKNVIAEDLGVSAIPGTISVQALEDTNLLTMTATASDPQLAQDILQSAIDNYPTVAEFVIGRTQMDLLDASGVPTEPVNPPDFKGQAKQGLLIGLALGVAIIVIYALTRKTIRRVSDFKKILNVSCFGTVPRVVFKKRKQKIDETISIHNPKIPLSFIESIRIIRTRVDKEARNRKVKTILVTSSIPGEGKTTTAANLALALAQKDNRVTLIDCDLRHPSVRQALGLDASGTGVSEVLQGKQTYAEAKQVLEDWGISVLGGGETVRNPAEMLASPKMKELLREAKRESDFVILDTAPCGMLADATALAQYVDGAIYVVKQDYAKVDRILEGLEQLNESKIDILGCILNGVESSLTGSYGGYNYGRYGKYGYGYYGIDTEKAAE